MFPKLVFAIRDGLNHQYGDPNYDIKAGAGVRQQAHVPGHPQLRSGGEGHRLVQNADGCRSFLGTYEQDGELVHDGRNNIGVISLNLPRVALEAMGR